LISQKFTPFESLLKSEEEEEEEQIALVMSSFFDIDKDESDEKDNAGTILVSKCAALPATDVTIPSSPKFKQMAAVVTPFSHHSS
jgi:hypothetical protein